MNDREHWNRPYVERGLGVKGVDIWVLSLQGRLPSPTTYVCELFSNLKSFTTDDSGSFTRILNRN